MKPAQPLKQPPKDLVAKAFWKYLAEPAAKALIEKKEDKPAS